MWFSSALGEQVRRTPDAVAARSGHDALTYAELDRRATNLAWCLVQRGIGAESIIGVALPRSIDLLVGLVGVLKSGAAYLPLDATYPSARLRHCIDDAGCHWVVTTCEQSASMPPHVRRMLLDDPACRAELQACVRAGTALPSTRMGGDRGAYVIYTSGSTGLPKGVVVSHRALSTFIAAATERRCVVPGDRILALTTIAFDISILELLVPLCHGCEVIIADVDSARDPLGVARLLRRHQPTVVQATPSQWRAIVQQHGDALRDVRVLVGGEPLPRDLAALLGRASAGVLNLYGPTEATVWASAARVSDDDVAASAAAIVTIGSPLPGYQVYLLDGEGRETPPGEIGEICIAGAGLARGYRNKPGLTAERFVANPYAGVGERMYRTGDRAVRRDDGNVAFLGRNDSQVKIRGHRIELGEIEAALLSHHVAMEAVVTAQPEEQRILAYVVCRTDRAARGSSRLAEWQSVWDSTYAQAADAPGDFNIAGWQNSFTSAPMPDEEMYAWVTDTVGVIESLGARRVLEIGCGTGLLLARLAPRCESYRAVDFSSQALAFVRRHVDGQPALAHVELLQAAAHELSSLPSACCDLVILNSVVQYFPDAGYLRRVLAEAARIATRGGRIFVGDVRNLALAEAYHAAVQLHRAPDELAAGKLKQRVAASVARETELLLAPAFFDAMVADDVGIAASEIRLKAGPYDNELTQFRYDVLLTAGAPPRTLAEPARWIEWDPGGRWKQHVEGALGASPGMTLGLRDILDRRVTRAVATARLVADGEYATAGEIRQASARAAHGQDAEDVVRLARASGAPLSFRGVDARGRYDVLFNPRWQAAPPASDRPKPSAAASASDPTAARRGDTISVLRQHLRSMLPPFMLPAAIIELERLPLTANGKLDRAALPIPTFATAATYEAPRTAGEEVLCDLFEEVLRVGVIGVHDNFFELGGHSLSAARLAALVQARFDVAVSMHALFAAPSVAGLAAYIGAGRRRRPADHVVALRAHGSLPPLFCLPPVYGLSFAYAGLARELDPNRRIYCLQASGIRDGESFAATLHEAAHGYVTSIRAIDPDGPYHLFGWSFGGLMAFAVACLLQRQGHAVAQLAVVDAYPRAMSAHGRLGSVSRYLDGFREHLEDAVREEVDEMQIDRLLRLSINHAMFMTSFRPDVFEGDMMLVAAPENRDLPVLWEPFVRGRLETYVIDSDHMHMMTREHLPAIGSLVEMQAKRAPRATHEPVPSPLASR